MNLIKIAKQYNTKKKCVDYLEKLRWGNHITCNSCGSTNTLRLKNELGRYHCNDCKTNFSVLEDTIFEESRLPLTKWFLLIGLMLNAKTGISAKELQRNLGCTYKTAWYCAMRVRCSMIDNCATLQDIVEMDECYVGGKPRHRNSPANKANLSEITFKRGRGTNKISVVGIVQRKGKVVLKVIEVLSAVNLRQMLKENVDTDNAIVMTDELSSYKKFSEIVEHLSVNHSKKEYVRGIVHTNTIEGFWSIIKNSIRGNYKALSRKYLPFYLVQAQYIYNYRDYKGNLFDLYMKGAVTHSKCMFDYKPTKSDTRRLMYRKCKKTI